MKNIVAETRYSPVLAHTAVVRSPEVDWEQPECPRCYSYYYFTADMRKLPAIHRGGRSYPASKP